MMLLPKKEYDYQLLLTLLKTRGLPKETRDELLDLQYATDTKQDINLELELKGIMIKHDLSQYK